MTSSSELFLTWHSVLTKWLPCVMANLTLEFLRVDHVVRVVPCEIICSPDLAIVRKWLFVKVVPIEVLYFWFEALSRRRFDGTLLTFGKSVLDRYLRSCAAGVFPEGSCFTPLPSIRGLQLVNSCRDEIWRDLETLLRKFSGPIASLEDVANWPKARAFLNDLATRTRAVAFDGETGECFACDRDTLTNVNSLFVTDVLCATEQAWKRLQGSFSLRDNVIAIVDVVVAQDGQTRIAFDYPAGESQ